MNNWKLIVPIVFFSSLMLACKGSKCDCPSFKPKSEINKEHLNHATNAISQDVLFAFLDFFSS
jgi:hypothetical protein